MARVGHMNSLSRLVIPVLGALLLHTSSASAVPFEPRPPHLRNQNIMSDPTFLGAISDLRLREIVADIEAGRNVIAKRKLVKFLQAVPGNIQAVEILGTLLMNEGDNEKAAKLL
jgi:hypothetical protein